MKQTCCRTRLYGDRGVGAGNRECLTARKPWACVLTKDILFKQLRSTPCKLKASHFLWNLRNWHRVLRNQNIRLLIILYNVHKLHLLFQTPQHFWNILKYIIFSFLQLHSIELSQTWRWKAKPFVLWWENLLSKIFHKHCYSTLNNSLTLYRTNLL